MRFPLLLGLLISCSLSSQRVVYHDRGAVLTDSSKSRIEKIAEMEIRFYTSVFGQQEVDPVNINLYSDTTTFRKAQRRSMFYVRSETGVYNAILKRGYVLNRDGVERTVFHEISHAFYYEFSFWHPIWIDEGLGMYFSYVMWDSLGTPTIGRSTYNTKMVKKYIADSTYDIRTVLRRSRVSFYMKDRARNYTISYSLVYYLKTYHSSIFKEVVLGSRVADKSYRVLEKKYPGGIAQLEKDLIAFYQNQDNDDL